MHSTKHFHLDQIDELVVVIRNHDFTGIYLQHPVQAGIPPSPLPFFCLNICPVLSTHIFPLRLSLLSLPLIVPVDVPSLLLNTFYILSPPFYLENIYIYLIFQSGKEILISAVCIGLVP